MGEGQGREPHERPQDADRPHEVEAARRDVERARAELREAVDQLSRRATDTGAAVRQRATRVAVPAAASLAGLVLISAVRRRRRR